MNGKRIPLKDGIRFIHEENEAIRMERYWARLTNWYGNHPEQYPEGFHHMGMHWAEIYSIVPKEAYRIGVLRVAHFKLGTKHIKCLRKERLYGGVIRWVLAFHWEGHCPACQKPTLQKRRPAKLIRRDNGRPKLIRKEE